MCVYHPWPSAVPSTLSPQAGPSPCSHVFVIDVQRFAALEVEDEEPVQVQKGAAKKGGAKAGDGEYMSVTRLAVHALPKVVCTMAVAGTLLCATSRTQRWTHFRHP